MPPRRLLPAQYSEQDNNSLILNPTVETSRFSQQIYQVLVVSSDETVFESLNAFTRLELTHTPPQDFPSQNILNQSSFFDVIIIDTKYVKDLKGPKAQQDLIFSKLSQPVIFVETEEGLEHNQLNYQPGQFLSYSDLTIESLVNCVNVAIVESRLKQAIEENNQQLTALISDLQGKHSFLTAVLDQLPNPVFVKDKDLRYIAYNKAFKDAYIKQAEEWHGKTLLDIKQSVYENPQAVHDGQLKLLEKNSSYSQEYNVVTNDNQNLSILGTVSAFEYLEGEKQGLIGVVQDITELKATENKLTEALKKQEDISRKLEQLNQLSLDLTNYKNFEEIQEVFTIRSKLITEADRIAIVQFANTSSDYKVYSHTVQYTGYEFDGQYVADKTEIFSKLISTKQPIIISIDDIPNDSRLAKQGYTCFVAFPIIVKDRVTASITAASHSKNAFTLEEQLWLQQLASTISITLQKQNLLEQTQRTLSEKEIQAQRLSGLNELSKKLMVAANRETICKLVLQELPKLIKSELTSFAFPTLDKEYLETIILNQDDERLVSTGNTWSIKRSPLGDVVTQRKIIFKNLECDSQLAEGLCLGLKSCIGAPLIVEDKVLGTLNLTSTIANGFSKQDEAFLLQVASLTAATIQNKTLFEETKTIAFENASLHEQAQTTLKQTQSHAARLAGLNELTKELMTVSSHNIICNMILNELPKLIACDSAYFAFFTEDRKFLKTYQNSEDGKRFEATGRTWPVKNISIGEAVSKRKIIRLNFENNTFDDCAFALSLELHSGMLAPLIVEDKIFGSLSIVSKHADAFDKQDEVFMQQITSLAAATIENKRLFEESQDNLHKFQTSERNFRELYSIEERHSKELILLDRIQKAISNKIGLEQIFDTVIETLAETLDYKAFAFTRIFGDNTFHRKSQAFGYPSKYDDYSTKLNQGILGRAARSGKAILVENVHEDPDYIALFDDVISNIAVPVLNATNPQESKIIGMLMVEHNQPLTEADLNLMVKISEQLSIAIENTILQEQTLTALTETKKQAQRLTELNKLSSELIFASDIETICRTILNRVPKFVDCNSASFTFLSEDKKEILVFKNDGSKFEATGRVWPLENTFINEAFTTKKIMFANFSEDYIDIETFRNQGFKSGIVTPLVVEDQVLGAVNVLSKQSEAYNKQDEAFMQQFASILAATFENKRLFEESQQTLKQLQTNEQELLSLYAIESRKSNELELLERVQSAIADKLALEQIFETVAKTIAELLGYKAMAFSEIVNDRIYHKKVQSFGYGNAIKDGFNKPIDQGIIGIAATSKQPILVQDVHSNPNYDLVFEDVVSNMAVPVFRNSEIMGVIIVEHTDTLDEADLNLLVKISKHLTIAIENATLHEQVLKDLNQSEALYKISQILRSTDSIEASSFNQVMEILADALQAQWILNDSTESAGESLAPIPFVGTYSSEPSNPDVSSSKTSKTETSSHINFMMSAITTKDFSRKESLPYWCIQNKTPVLAENGAEDPRESSAVKEYKESLGMGSIIVSPIFDSKDKNRAIGSLSVARKNDQPNFSQSDLNFLVSVSHQISMAQSQKELTKQVQFQTLHDALTGLPNRELFEKRLEQDIQLVTEKQSNVGLLFLDLDGFKNINDSFNHRVGDLLLQQVALRLQSKTRHSDTLARMGGDEFAIILSNIDTLDQAIEFASEYIQTFEHTFQVLNNSISITASIGLSMFPDDGHSIEALLKHADIAMYLAKAQGKNGIQIFSQDLADKARERLRIESNLRLAIERDEFILHYQPQYCLDTGVLKGVEALIRWNHAKKGLIPPSQFVPIAEETLIIIEMGKWALHEACHQTVEWHKTGHALSISVNVAAPQLAQADFIETVVNALRFSGLPAEYLELEITEGVVMGNVNLVAEKLQELRNLGVSIALDDFGTGFSSLQYLQKLPFDKLKIDRSFIMNIKEGSDDNRDKVLVKNIVQLANGFELKVVAEGIETLAQANYLKTLGCEYAQGFYYAKPSMADEIFDNSEEVLEKITGFPTIAQVDVSSQNMN